MHLIRQGGVGPVRTKARGGAASARAPARKEREKPKTAEELDQELEAFMKDEITAAPAAATAASAPAANAAAVPAAENGDVEMA